MTSIADDLKTAVELIGKATELIGAAAKETFLPSETLRHTVHEEIVRIRLKLMLLRRDLTVLHTTANRRKPRTKKRSSDEDRFGSKL